MEAKKGVSVIKAGSNKSMGSSFEAGSRKIGANMTNVGKKSHR